RNTLTINLWAQEELRLTFSPARLACVGVAVLLILLLYRNITTLGRLTFVFWLGILGIIAWILIEGWTRFDPAIAFDWPERVSGETGLAAGLAAAMTLA